MLTSVDRILHVWFNFLLVPKYHLLITSARFNFGARPLVIFLKSDHTINRFSTQQETTSNPTPLYEQRSRLIKFIRSADKFALGINFNWETLKNDQDKVSFRKSGRLFKSYQGKDR